MITINLLPEEMRAVGPGPASTQLLVFGISASIGLVSLFFFLFMHFYVLASHEERLASLKSEREALRKYEKEHVELGTTIEFFKKHKDAVELCTSLRIPFSRKIHELSSLVIFQNPTSWLNNLTIGASRQAAAGKKGGAVEPRFTWKSQVTTAANELHVATKFHRTIQKSDFFKDFLQLNIPRYTQVNNAGYQQKISWNYELDMLMQMRPTK